MSVARKTLLVLVLVAVTPAFGAAPNINRVSPYAITPGKKTTLTFSGDNLAGAVDLWTSFGCDITAAGASNATTFELKAPKRIGPGLGAIRLVATNGLSSLHLLLIDPLPTIEASPTNHSPQAAQRIAKSMAVDGVCEELRSEFFRVTAGKGDRLNIEVVAQRLGSPLDPLLRVLDAQGRELALNEDAPGLGVDARLDFRCPKAGDYVIEIRDTRYAGGARHRYRLRLGSPLPTPLPFLGSPDLEKLTQPLTSLPVAREIEPNDEPARAQAVGMPVELSGRFDRPGDRDVYEFHARKGSRIIVAGKTRSLGSPCDLFVQLQTANGTRLAEANATAADDGLLTNRFNVDGRYRLVVEELNRNGGPALAYRVAMRELGAGFALSTETERVSLPAGDSIEIEVKHERREYDGPIQLAVHGLPDGFTVSNAVITAKTNTTKLKLNAPPDLALGELFHFNITGSALVDSASVSERVSTLPALRSLFPELRHPPAELDGLIALSISESKSSSPRPPQRRRRQ